MYSSWFITSNMVANNWYVSVFFFFNDHIITLVHKIFYFISTYTQTKILNACKSKGEKKRDAPYMIYRLNI